MSVLYIFSGLPGSGKTTLAQQLATVRHAAYVRIDTIEQALRDLCGINVEGEGYRLAYRVAGDNLRLGMNVVADSCNPVQLTRTEWEDIARTAEARYINIEVVCSNEQEHRRRIDSRKSTVPRLALPTWDDVLRRNYEPWSKDRLVVDTATRTANKSLAELLTKLAALE